MGLDSYIAKQISNPSGRFAPLVARLLNSGNRALNLEAIADLDLRPGMRVLDIGFGGGVSLPELAARVGDHSMVAGIDLSAAMVGRARGRFRQQLRAGRLELEQGSIESMPWPDAAFDRALSVNTIFYWPDTGAGLREVWRVLRPDGVLALAMRSQRTVAPAHLERFGFKNVSAPDLERLLAAAGFSGIVLREVAGGLAGGAVVARAVKRQAGAER
jgi:arsenite methyltransferase